MNASERERAIRMAMFMREHEPKDPPDTGIWIWRYDMPVYKYWNQGRYTLVTTIDEADQHGSKEKALRAFCRERHVSGREVTFVRIEQDDSGEWRDAETARLEEVWAETCAQCGEMCRDSIDRDGKRTCIRCVDAELSTAIRRAEEAEAKAARAKEALDDVVGLLEEEEEMQREQGFTDTAQGVSVAIHLIRTHGKIGASDA